MHKYENMFNFFLAKPISQIQYDDSKSIPNIWFKDVVSFSDDTEFMNRIYRYFNSLGKEEIYDRIRLIGGFYGQNMALPEHPLMILSHTTKIFMTRQRRLRKMIASDCSSDETDPPEQEEAEFETHGFLKSITSLSSSCSPIHSMFGSEQRQQSYDSDTHDVYGMDVQIYEASTLKIKRNQVEDLSHLICDFKDFNVEQTIQNYQRLSEAKYSQNQVPLKALGASNPVYKSVFINEVNNQEEILADHIFNKKRAAHRRINDQERFQLRHNNQMPNPNGRQMKSHSKILQEYRLRRKQYYSPESNIGEERRESANRKKRIRERAIQLLVKVKKQEYVSTRTQYDL